MPQEAFLRWRASVELTLVHYFEKEAHVSYWNARDAALSLIKRSKGLKKMHRDGISPFVAAAKLSPWVKS